MIYFINISSIQNILIACIQIFNLIPFKLTSGQKQTHVF